MGFYIQTPEPKQKVTQLTDLYGAERTAQPAALDDVPADKALVCVVDNGPFEAVALVHDEREFTEFTLPQQQDPRPHTWLLLDKAKAHELAGYVPA